MKLFGSREHREAIRYAAAGGQALHVHGFNTATHGRFGKAAREGKPIAHLFDWDLDRLDRTARGLGVVHRYYDRRGGALQHHDLCGRPLDKAVACCVSSVNPPAAAWGALFYYMNGTRPEKVDKYPPDWPGQAEGWCWYLDDVGRVVSGGHCGLPAELLAALPQTAAAGFVSRQDWPDDTRPQADAAGLFVVKYRTRQDAKAALGAGLAALDDAGRARVLGRWADPPTDGGRMRAADFAARCRERFRVCEPEWLRRAGFKDAAAAG